MVALVSTKYELYGGALGTKLPGGLSDASDFRQVPDTQEVLVNPSENSTDYRQLNADDSIIFDLMERVEGSDVEAMKEHFSEISQLNGVQEYKLLTIKEDIENLVDSSALLSVGVEPAFKWGRDEKSTLVVVIGLIRLKKVETDVLVTFNVLIKNPRELQDLEKLNVDNFEQDEENLAYKRIKIALTTVETAINEFQVYDWGLFA